MTIDEPARIAEDDHPGTSSGGDQPASRAMCSLLGHSAPMGRLREQIIQAARSDAPALIRGETGTGKEMVALAIHQESERRAGPFVKLSCMGAGNRLLEIELFGERNRPRPGAIELARGGTLLLDEVSDLTSGVQARIARGMKGPLKWTGDRGVSPIGEVRVIATTNRDIRRDMLHRRFRKDLFSLLSATSIDVPPLRKRGQDIIELAEHFVRRYADEFGRETGGLDDASLRRLVRYNWPGNVRELQNVIRSAILTCPSGQPLASRLFVSLGTVRRSAKRRRKT
jgi:two-component system response regulator HydG